MRNGYGKKKDELVNPLVSQQALLNLQAQLFDAASMALNKAMEDGNIPSSLLSSCHNIVKDAGVSPDTFGQEEATIKRDSEEDSSPFGQLDPNWLENALGGLPSLSEMRAEVEAAKAKDGGD